MKKYTSLISRLRRASLRHRRIKLSLLLLFVSILSVLIPTDPSSVDAQINTERLNAGIVKLKTSTGEIGAGFVVGVKGNSAYILTAYHVVKGTDRISVTFYRKRNQSFSGSLRQSWVDEKLDLSIVQVDGFENGLIPDRKLYPINGLPSDGEQVMVIGHPGDLDWQPDYQKLSRAEYLDDRRKFLYSSPSLQRGNSGAPIFDDGGSLIGMATERGPSGNQVAVAFGAIMAFLQENKIPDSALDYEVLRTSARNLRVGDEVPTTNRPPKVFLSASTKSVNIPCACRPDLIQHCSDSCTPSSKTTIQLTADASDPDGDPLRYHYSSTMKFWRVVGDGPNVTLDLSKLFEPINGYSQSGSWTVDVEVSDQRGGLAIGTVDVNFQYCGKCR